MLSKKKITTITATAMTAALLAASPALAQPTQDNVVVGGSQSASQFQNGDFGLLGGTSDRQLQSMSQDQGSDQRNNAPTASQFNQSEWGSQSSVQDQVGAGDLSLQKQSGSQDREIGQRNNGGPGLTDQTNLAGFDNPLGNQFSSQNQEFDDENGSLKTQRQSGSQSQDIGQRNNNSDVSPFSIDDRTGANYAGLGNQGLFQDQFDNTGVTGNKTQTQSGDQSQDVGQRNKADFIEKQNNALIGGDQQAGQRQISDDFVNDQTQSLDQEQLANQRNNADLAGYVNLSDPRGQENYFEAGSQFAGSGDPSDGSGAIGQLQDADTVNGDQRQSGSQNVDANQRNNASFISQVQGNASLFDNQGLGQVQNGDEVKDIQKQSGSQDKVGNLRNFSQEGFRSGSSGPVDQDNFASLMNQDGVQSQDGNLIQGGNQQSETFSQFQKAFTNNRIAD